MSNDCEKGESPSLTTVTIVIISYNQGRYLEEAIASVLDQNYPRVERTMLDGGSTDGSIEIIEKYSSAFAYCRSGPDGGPAAALNDGFQHSTGEILAFLNSDDVLRPWAVREWVAAFKDNPEAGVVYGDVEFIDGNGNPTTLPGKHVSTFRAGTWHPRAHAAGALMIPQQASAWKRDVFDFVGGFNVKNKTSWDGEFFAQATMAGFKFKLIKKVLASFRVHPDSISGSGRLNSLYLEDLRRVHEQWRRSGIEVSKIEGTFWRFLVRTERFLRQPSAVIGILGR
jgi:glycosyltransferase involved in cell wall biosynthesis